MPDNTTDLKLAATHSKDWNAKYINKNVSMVILGGLFFELELQIIQCFIYNIPLTLLITTTQTASATLSSRAITKRTDADILRARLRARSLNNKLPRNM